MTAEPTPAPSSSTSLTVNSSEGATNPPEDKTRLISLAEAAERYGFNRIYLAGLARKGRLKAQKVGNMWVTTPADVEDFIRSREKRGAYRSDIGLDNS